MDLIDESKTYEVKYPGDEKEEEVIFVMKHWIVGMQDQVDRDCVESDGNGGLKFLVSKERELKLRLALANWRGIKFDGSPAPCNDENKKKLPLGVIYWIVKEIDEKAGLVLPDSEKKTLNLQLS